MRFDRLNKRYYGVNRKSIFLLYSYNKAGSWKQLQTNKILLDKGHIEASVCGDRIKYCGEFIVTNLPYPLKKE